MADGGLSELKQHVKNSHGSVHNCCKCDYSGLDKKRLREHEEMFHGVNEENLLRCGHCPFKTVSKRRLLEHRKTVHEGLGRKCGSCEFETSSPSRLKLHALIKHPRPDVSKEAKEGETILVQDAASGAAECSVCHAACQTEMELTNHLMSKHVGVVDRDVNFIRS